MISFDEFVAYNFDADNLDTELPFEQYHAAYQLLMETVGGGSD